MIVARHLGMRLLGWVGLALALLLGVAALVSGVETARYGAGAALRLALLESPVLVLPLSPMVCALAAGVAAARLQALGEADALQAMGWSPGQLALIPLTVGLAVGVALGLCRDAVVPPAAEAALELRSELGALGPEASWIWTGDEAVRVADGLRVRAKAGRLDAPRRGPPPGAAEIRRARALAWPSLARAAELRDAEALPLRVEAGARRVRPLACALLAALAWLGPSSRSRRRVGPALVLAIGFSVLLLAVHAQAAQGLLPPPVGVLLPVGLLVVGLGWRAWPSVRPEVRAQRTVSQKPV